MRNLSKIGRSLLEAQGQTVLSLAGDRLKMGKVVFREADLDDYNDEKHSEQPFRLQHLLAMYSGSILVPSMITGGLRLFS